MSAYIVVCPVGGHPGNFEHFGPFEGRDHARLWVLTVHARCEWGGDKRDFQYQSGHQIRPLGTVAP